MQLHETGENRDLLLEFFLSFARFEYALKTTGRARRPSSVRAVFVFAFVRRQLKRREHHG